MANRIELFDRNGNIGIYQLQPQTKYKKLRKFLSIGCGIYAMNNIGCRYYWCEGMKQGGDWFKGGYYVSPFIYDFCDVYANLETSEIYKHIK